MLGPRPDTGPEFATGLVWFRRDLRCTDHAALHHALTRCQQVHCVFVFDRDILDSLPRSDRRVDFIQASVVELDAALRALQPSSGLITLHAVAREAIPALAQRLHAQAVFANHDDEPQALARDAQVRGALAHSGIVFKTGKDHVIFERQEVLTQQGTPYGVFTPYRNAWMKKITPFYLQAYPVARHAWRLAPRLDPQPVPSLQALGFTPSNLAQLPLPTGAQGGQQLFSDFCSRIAHYHQRRDFPGLKGPSYLGVHLRFGTLSIRQLAREAHLRAQQGCPGASVWLNELIWRDFYAQILGHFPHVAQGAFKPAYDAIVWERGKPAQALFAAWCQGRTGYPLVDAAMAQLNQTGYMHNRLRMVVASFLAKDLGLDWRWGEAYFATHLNDFDLASNNGGWQWASSSGCDAQPFFRIFNPVSQSLKFDPEGKFIRRYLPQLAALPTPVLHAPWQAQPLELQEAGVVLGQNYPQPLVDHATARARTLQRYAVVKNPPTHR